MKDYLKTAYLNIRKFSLCCFSVLLSQKKVYNINPNGDIKNVLFIRIDRIGDLVLSTPALKGLKQKFPNCELTVLAGYSNHSVVLNNPYIDKIIIYDSKLSILKKISIIRQLRESNFDLVVDPYDDYELKTALITAVSGAGRRIGYASYGREVFFNIAAPSIKKGQHFIDVVQNVLSPLGIAITDKEPEIFLSQTEKNWSKKWILQNQSGNKAIVGIHPGAYYPSQRWVPGYFAELINKLTRSKNLDLILFGSPSDKNLIKQIIAKIPENVLTFVADDLRQFISLLAYCDIFICNNSGPLHLAVGTKTPTISFMGPTDRDRWMPVGSMHKVFREDNLPCIGCNRGTCASKEHDCMRLITPFVVKKAIEEYLYSNKIMR